MTDARAAQTALRALVASPGDARSAQVSARVLIQTKTQSQLAGLSIDVATKPSPESRLAGLSTDVAVVATPESRLAGLSVDVAVPTYTSTEPANTAYTTAVKADSPLAYWRLEDGIESTRVYDSSGNARHGVRTGGNDVFSIADGGRGVEFTGVSGTGIDCGASNILGTGYANMSTECWARTTSAASQQVICQARDYSGATGSNNWQMQFTNGKVGCNFYCATTYLEPVTTLSYNDGKWHHIVGVYNGATLKMYVDGVEVFSQALVGGNVNSGGTARLKMGNFGGSTVASGTGTNVAFDEVAIYGTALSATQVANHYAARLATATQAQTSRESLRVATQTVGSAQVSRESLRVATQTVGAAQVTRESLRVAVQAPGGVTALYHQAVQAVVSTADVALYHQAVQAVVQYGPPVVPVNARVYQADLRALTQAAASNARAYQVDLRALTKVSGPTWSVWNGTAEVAATATVWNGTAEIATTTEIAP